MNVVFIGAGILVVCFGGVLLFGAPYLPTLSPQVRTALALAELQPGATLLELGCGDGKVLIAAAQQGIYCVGYELNPLLALLAWARTRRYRRYVRIKWGDFWRASWPPADAIFVFLLPKYMDKLDKKVIQYSSRPVKVISFAFEIPGKKASREQQGLYLYNYR